MLINKAFFIVIGLLCSILLNPCKATPPLTIISVINSKFKGDADQVKGIERTLTALATAQQRNVKLIELDSNNIFVIDSVFQPESQVVVISSNDYGVNALKTFYKSSKKFLGVLTSHQYFSALDNAIASKQKSGINIVALPKHVLTSQIRNNFSQSSIKLIETIGVAQNLIPADCDKSFAQNSTDIIGLPGTNRQFFRGYRKIDYFGRNARVYNSMYSIR